MVYRSGIFYTPEGERKRVLALPIEEGREYFKSKEDYLTFVTKRMIAYFDAKEKRPGRSSQSCMTPGSCFATFSFSIAMVCMTRIVAINSS